MVFNAAFNSISVISWRLVFLVGENGGTGKKHDLPQVTDQLYHKMLYQVPVHLAELGFKLTLVVIRTDCIDGCKSNYQTTTAPHASAYRKIFYLYLR